MNNGIIEEKNKTTYIKLNYVKHKNTKVMSRSHTAGNFDLPC